MLCVLVVICLKISTFVVYKTTIGLQSVCHVGLWFAWKSVPLWYIKQHHHQVLHYPTWLWFAWKSVPLWYIKQRLSKLRPSIIVVICLKISTFVVYKTTYWFHQMRILLLWFAWKSVPLWYIKQRMLCKESSRRSCDLLENQYLCGI